MRVLAISPYHGGSHQALLDGWIAGSRHEFLVLSLPPYHFKWRMRHAAVTISAQIRDRGLAELPFDAVFCTSMLNLAELRGLLPQAIRRPATVVYFHENQLAYPVRHDEPRDLHFAFTNLTTALSADAVWFNSAYNRDTLLDGLGALLRRMPDYGSLEPVAQVAARSRIMPPGVELVGSAPRPSGQPLHVLWAARWEYDKGPEAFFEALRALLRRGIPFRVSVLGASYREVPECFRQAREQLGRRIVRWGFLDDRNEYHAALREADVVVSTAAHEFFGIAVAEAVSAGCFPVLPNRLAYPEFFDPDALYDGTVIGLVDRLCDLAELKRTTGRLPTHHLRAVDRFSWMRTAPAMDAALEAVVAPPGQARSPGTA